MGRARTRIAAGGGLCAEALPGEPRQTPRRPVQAVTAPAAARRGDQGAGGTAPPEAVAEQQAQAILFGTDGHPAHNLPQSIVKRA